MLARDWLSAPTAGHGPRAPRSVAGLALLAGHAPAADNDLARCKASGCMTPGSAWPGAARCSGKVWPNCAASPARRAAALPPPRLLGRVRPAAARRAARNPSSARTSGSSPSTACSGRRAGRRPGRGDLDDHGRAVRARTVRPLDAETDAALHRRRRRDTVPRQAGTSGAPVSPCGPGRLKASYTGIRPGGRRPHFRDDCRRGGMPLAAWPLSQTPCCQAGTWRASASAEAQVPGTVISRASLCEWRRQVTATECHRPNCN